MQEWARYHLVMPQRSPNPRRVSTRRRAASGPLRNRA